MTREEMKKFANANFETEVKFKDAVFVSPELRGKKVFFHGTWDDVDAWVTFEGERFLVQTEWLESNADRYPSFDGRIPE